MDRNWMGCHLLLYNLWKWAGGLGQWKARFTGQFLLGVDSHPRYDDSGILYPLYPWKALRVIPVGPRRRGPLRRSQEKLLHHGFKHHCVRHFLVPKYQHYEPHLPRWGHRGANRHPIPLQRGQLCERMAEAADIRSGPSLRLLHRLAILLALETQNLLIRLRARVWALRWNKLVLTNRSDHLAVPADLPRHLLHGGCLYAHSLEVPDLQAQKPEKAAWVLF